MSADGCRQSRFPRLLENPGKSLIYFSEISRTWNVLETEIGPGNFWKLKCRVLESPGIISWFILTNGHRAKFGLLLTQTKWQ